MKNKNNSRTSLEFLLSIVGIWIILWVLITTGVLDAALSGHLPREVSDAIFIITVGSDILLFFASFFYVSVEKAKYKIIITNWIIFYLNYLFTSPQYMEQMDFFSWVGIITIFVLGILGIDHLEKRENKEKELEKINKTYEDLRTK